MRKLILSIALLITISTDAQKSDPISKTIIETEKTALERWNHDDTSGFLEISANDVVYFDPVVDCLSESANLKKFQLGIRNHCRTGTK